MTASKTASDMIPAGVEIYQRGTQVDGAGPFKTGQPIKLWRSKAQIGAYKYLGKNDNGQADLLPHPAIANYAELNIPHLHHFMTWDDWRKTRAVSQTLQPKGDLVPRDWLFFPAEAAAIASKVSADTGSKFTAVEAVDYRGLPFEFNYPDGEQRRIWKIKEESTGQLWDLNDLWENMTRGSVANPTNRGVGSPGTFINNMGSLHYVAGNQDEGATETREIPPPCRDLFPNEEVVLGTELMNANQVVVRDKTVTPPPLPTSVSGLTVEEHGWLEAIYKYIKS